MSSELPPAGEPRIPLHAEELSVSRRQTAGDTLQVSTVTREHARFVDEMLNHERVEIERVPIGRPVDAIPPVRQEGDTTIMSVVDETIVIERRLILKEEVRIRHLRVSERHQETVVLRKQEAVITRVEPLGADVASELQEK
jgi:stress response protein YsnF